MKNRMEHNKRVVTELWHHLEKKRTDNNTDQISKQQRDLLQIAYEKYDLIDSSDPTERKSRGIRVPVLMEASEILKLAFQEDND